MDNTVDVYHQSRKIAFVCPAFRTEVRFYFVKLLIKFSCMFFIRMNTEICMNGLKIGQKMN
jgi:hypothetical protein